MMDIQWTNILQTITLCNNHTVYSASDKPHFCNTHAVKSSS